MDLSDLGIVNSSLCEAIVTTYHGDGLPNAAPMGVFGLGENELMLRVHEDTDTYENIRRGKCCVVNIVFDPLLFLKCSLQGRHSGSGEIETQRVRRAGLVNAPYLEDAYAYVEAELAGVEEVKKTDSRGLSTVAKIILHVRQIEVLSPFPVAPNRGLFAAIELAISLSRGETVDVDKPMGIIKKTVTPSEYQSIEEFVAAYLKTKP